MTEIVSSRGPLPSRPSPFRLSPIPYLGSWPALPLTALALSVVVGAALVANIHVAGHFGDTDDAMRLVMARDLLHGQGWYDQLIRRLQPPEGLYMHWSRLLDGGLAGSMALVGLMLPSSRAELVVRTVWPVIWIFPAVISSLAIARNLGDRSAVFLTALLLAVDLSIYQQFLPGRIDHHDIQIVMALAAIACATAASQRTRWAIVAGAATGLGLGIGLEALAFQALVGANYALRLAGDRRQARSARAYGLTLAITSAAVFLVQTPPWRWSLSFCDALAFNSTCALVIAGLGIGVAAQAASRVSTTFRIGLIAFAGAAALGVYFTLDPHCLYGPFAEVDPTVRRLWLDRVQEVQSLAGVFWLDRPAAIGMGVILIMSFTAAMFLLVRAKCAPGTALALTLACLAFAGVMGIFVWRMTAYAAWFGLPVIGAAASYLAARRLNNRLLPSAAAILFLSPAVVSGAANAVTNAAKPDRSFAFREMRIQRCFAPAAFVQLQALPPGRVLSEPDIGPFILLFTRDSAFAAPYHRMWRAILASHGALDGPPGLAAPRARALGAAYVADCPALPSMGAAPGLVTRLRAGQTPPWLKSLSPPDAPLRIYGVRSIADATANP